MKEKHISVLLEESISSLNLKDDSIIVDCTLGYGGHSSNILARIKKGFLFAFDQDSEAIRHSTDRLNAVGTNFTIIKSNFVHLKEKLQELDVEKVDGVLFDLGVSSPQLDEKERGFSYHEDARLDMRMDRENPLSAYEVVNNYSKEELRCWLKNSFQSNRLPLTYGLFENNKIVGMYQFVNDDMFIRPDLYPWLANVYVEENSRNKGYSKLLLESIKENFPKNLSYKEIYLFTKYKGLYEKYDWKYVGEIDTFKTRDRIQRLYKFDL